MNRKFIAICISLTSMLLGIAYSVISADADKLKPFVPLAWVVIFIGGVLSIFFSVADSIRFRFLSLLFIKRNRLTQFQASIDKAEQKLVHDPELENVNDVLTQLNRLEEIGEDLKTMSLIYDAARRLLVELTYLIAPAMLRHTHQEKFIRLGGAAYNSAKRLELWNKAMMIAYYMACAYYSPAPNFSTNDGPIWVDNMNEIYTGHPNEELRPLLLEVKGLRIKDDSEKRADAKKVFNEALLFIEQHNLAGKPNIRRISKNIYYQLGDLAERESNRSESIIYYEQALDPISKDFFKQLSIYERLGELVLLNGDFEKAQEYYNSQLELAEKNSSPIGKYSAHKGLAKALSEKSPPDVEKAYLHAKQALEITKERAEDNPSENKSDEYEILAIMIDISNKMFDAYRSLLHGGALPSVSVP